MERPSFKLYVNFLFMNNFFLWNTHQTLVWSTQYRARRLLQKLVVISRQCIEKPQQRESIVEPFLLFAGCWIITLSSCHVLILFGNPHACDSLELNFHSRYLSHTSLSDDDFHHIFMSRNIRIYFFIPSLLHPAQLLLSLSHYLIVKGSNYCEIFPHFITFKQDFTEGFVVFHSFWCDPWLSL